MTDYSNHVAVDEITRGDLNKIETTKRDFGLLDRKGRAIGYLWTVRPIMVRALSEDEKAARRAEHRGWRLVTADVVAASAPVEVRFHVTKNGVSFGASNGSEYYGSRDIAMSAMEAKATQARKRYAAKEQGAR